MTYEFYQILWFVLIAVLWTGFFLLEGFDFGVGMLLPFIGKNDLERRAVINTIGPVWDGNEVWLLTAGGATFAAFPHWYATMFSGFYLALLLLLAALILRGVSFEYRSKFEEEKHRRIFDGFIFAGSLLPPVLIGCAFANMLRGTPIDSTMTFQGNLLTLLNPYGLIGGLSLTALFLLHGMCFLSLKLSGPLLDRIKNVSGKIWIAALSLYILFGIGTYAIGFLPRGVIIPGAIPVMALAALILAGSFLKSGRAGWAFIMTSLVIVLTVAAYFTAMFPNLMISSLNSAWNLTMTNASSSLKTLSVMSVVALCLVPVVLAYQIWTYWVFRKRISAVKKDLIY